MKYILLFLLLPLFTFGQSNYDIRADSVRIYKSGGFSELVLRNKTKDSVNGILTNLGNGITAFVRVKKINDSSFTVGTDTISLKGGITTGGTDSTLANLWGIKILQSGIVRYLMADSFAVESRARGNKIADSIGVRLDTSKNNVWAAMMARVINGGGASKITVGAIGSRPAASNCQCFWVSTSDSSISYDNGGWIPLGKGGIGGTPGGSSTQVQFNDGGSFSGNSGFVYNKTTHVVNADSITTHKSRPDSLFQGVTKEQIGTLDSAYYNGTSITMGTGASSSLFCFVNASAGMLRVIPRNDGQGGYQLQKSDNWPLTNDWINAGYYKGFIHRWADNDKWLIMEWGENDANNDYLYHASFHIDSTWFKSAYTEVLHWAIDSMGWPKSRIIIMSPFYQLTTRTPLSYQMKYYTSSKTVADSAGIKWVDVFTQGQTSGITSLYDDIHPNNRGHAKAAQVLFDSIASVVRAGNETLINTDTALFRNIRVQSKVLPDSSYWLMGLRGKDGLAFPIEPQRFARLDSNSLSLIANSQINSLWNYGNLTVTGSVQPGGGLMARGSSNYGAGAGAHFDYQGSDVVIDAFNATGGTHGKIKMPFGKLILQAPADVNVFTTALYGRGTGYFTSMYVSGDSALANSTDSAVVLKLGGGKNWGGMTSYKVNAGGTSYFPTVINFSGNAPTLFNTKIDNGLTNNGIQVAGPSFLADTVMLNNVPDGTTSDSLAALKQLSPGKFVIHKVAQSSLGGGSSNPFADNTALVKNNADNTKLWKVSAASINAGTTRTWTVPDYDGTFAAIDHTQTFSQKQTYSVANRFNGLSNPSNLAYKIAVIDSSTGDMYWVSPSSPINVYDLGSGGSQQRANTNGDSLYVRTSYTNGHADDILADGGINHVTGNVFNQTADGSVTNTNTTTSILGTGQGSKTIATGKLYVGQTIVVKGFGYISTDATTPTLTITFANSSSNSGNAVNSLLSSSMNNVPIEWEYFATIRTTGSSGSIQLNGWVSIGGTKAYLASSAASTFNTTTNQTFDVTALFNNASTNNTITTKQCTVSIN